VEIRFTYDLNGILEVETTVVSTGQKAAMVIERTPGRLTKEQIEEARKAMAKLKFHARDALPNVTALARADAVFVELAGAEREAMGRVIALFRVALEGQDASQIEAARTDLLALVSRHRRTYN
jgi:molecular chaperone HscC